MCLYFFQNVSVLVFKKCVLTFLFLVIWYDLACAVLPPWCECPFLPHTKNSGFEQHDLFNFSIIHHRNVVGYVVDTAPAGTGLIYLTKSSFSSEQLLPGDFFADIVILISAHTVCALWNCRQALSFTYEHFADLSLSESS